MRNGEMSTEEREKHESRCKRLIRENKIVVFLICCIIIAIIVGVLQIFVFLGLSAEKERNFRLPTNLEPSYYALEIKPYITPGNFKFEGKIEITVTCVEDTDEVVLHASGLQINEDKVNIQNVISKERLKVLRIKYDKENQFLIFQLLEDLKENESYRIFISYQGTLGEDGVGFYVSSHEDSHNVTRYTASTQFESIHAREAFPCFDEPAMKAKFDVTIVRWKNMTSLSNMNKIKTEPRDRGWEADVYQTSLKMSTYLVAFVIGDYVGKSRGKITVWSRPDEVNLANFSLQSSFEILQFYEKRLKPYTLPKLDMVPVTKLQSHAMENWGLIIFHHKGLLYNEDDNDTMIKQRITSIAAHEIAHQWFGNLVTPKWWSDIWLSEGLTTYMEHIGSKALFPQWYQLDKTTTSIYSKVIQYDCYSHGTVHKTVNRKISDPYIFDTFTYNKGAAVIRMAHQILGDHVFWKGLSTYLEKYAYGNAEENDLWECLTKAQYAGIKPNVNMTEIMTPWTHLGGLPIITVQRDYDSETATFSQEACNSDPDNFQDFKDDLWHIPISYTTAKNRNWNAKVSVWLTGKNVEVKNMPNEEEWILADSQGMGYYIVNYDRANWKLLAAQLRKNHEVFPPEQRFRILADANILETMDHITVDVLLDMSLFFTKETKLSIFSPLNLRFIWRYWDLLEPTIYKEEWKEYVTYIFEPAYKIVHQEDNDDDINMPIELRFLLLGVFCRMNHPPCVNKAKERYQFWKSNMDNYSEEFTAEAEREMQNLLCVAIKFGQKSDWDYMYNVYLNTSDELLLTPLSCSDDANQIKILLSMVLEKNQGGDFYIFYMLASTTNWKVFLSYLNDNFDEIVKNDDMLDSVITSFHFLYNPAKYEQTLDTCKKLITKLSGSKAESLQIAIDKMEKELPSLKKKKELIEMWLHKKAWTKHDN